MFARVSLAALAATFLFATAANADHRWRKHRYYFDPLDVITSSVDEADDEEYWLEPDDEDELTLRDMRERRKRWARVNDEPWWLEEDDEDDTPAAKPAKKIPAAVKTVDKPVVAKKPIAKAATAPKPKLKPAAPAPKLQSASLTPQPAPKVPKSVPVPVKPAVTTKPAPQPKLAGKTVGCTGGAAVITGLGFAAVRPRVCTGETFAYLATKDDGSYAIKLKAATGEVVDVKKLP